MILKISYKFTDNQEDRNDLTQDILLQLWRAHPSYTGRSKFSTWMYRVAYNKAISYKKKHNKQNNVIAFNENSYFSFDSDQFEEKEMIKQLYRTISRLKKTDKLILEHYLKGCRIKDIALMTGVSSNAISVRLVRIKKTLGADLREFVY